MIRALKSANSAKSPIYLITNPNSQSDFIQRNQNQFNDFVRMQAKNPSPPASAIIRKGTPPIRKLGQTRGSHSFHLNDDEKNYIRQYIWSPNRYKNPLF